MVSWLFAGSTASSPVSAGKRPLLDAIERERLPRHFDVVRDEGSFPHELVRLDDEAAHVPAKNADDEIADGRRHDRRDQPAQPRCGHRVDERGDRAERERRRDDQHPGQRDVGFGVGDAREDGPVREQAIEPSEVHANGENQQRRPRNRPTAPPRAHARRDATAAQHLGAAGDGDEDARDSAREHCKRQQPAGEQVPGGQREQVEGERLAEDRVDDARCVPASTNTTPASSTRSSCRRRSPGRRRTRRRARSAASPVQPAA